MGMFYLYWLFRIRSKKKVHSYPVKLYELVTWNTKKLNTSVFVCKNSHSTVHDFMKWPVYCVADTHTFPRTSLSLRQHGKHGVRAKGTDQETTESFGFLFFSLSNQNNTRIKVLIKWPKVWYYSMLILFLWSPRAAQHFLTQNGWTVSLSCVWKKKPLYFCWPLAHFITSLSTRLHKAYKCAHF